MERKHRSSFYLKSPIYSTEIEGNLNTQHSSPTNRVANVQREGTTIELSKTSYQSGAFGKDRGNPRSSFLNYLNNSRYPKTLVETSIEPSQPIQPTCQYVEQSQTALPARYVQKSALETRFNNLIYLRRVCRKPQSSLYSTLNNLLYVRAKSEKLARFNIPQSPLLTSIKYSTPKSRETPIELPNLSQELDLSSTHL